MSPSSSPVQDAALSRRKQEFESPWGRQSSPTWLRLARATHKGNKKNFINSINTKTVRRSSSVDGPDPYKKVLYFMFYYVYLIKSIAYPDKVYVGYTTNIKQRLETHNSGGSIHTALFRPWKYENYLVYLALKRSVCPVSGSAIFLSTNFMMVSACLIAIAASF